MKQLSLLTVLLCLLIGSAHAANVNGTILNASTSMPVANLTVYVTDSTNNTPNPFFLTAITDVNGNYSVTLPATTPINNTVQVLTFACGVTFMNSHTFTGSNITSNFTVCSAPPPPMYTIGGNITLGGVSNNGVADVYLIRATYDSVAQDWTLTAIDTMTTTNWGFYSATYASIPTGNLLLKAALRPNHPNYSGYLPTYYTSALVWSSGTYLTASNFAANATTSGTNINMTAGTNPGGPGFISGLVSQGANKTTGVGDPLSSRLLLLTTNSDQPVGYTYSDANGQFSFPNLAYGTYKIFGDAWGLQNPALTVTLSAATPGVTDVKFEENSSSFTGHIGSLSVSATQSNQPGIFPNPATDAVQLTGIDGSKNVVVRSLNGAVVLEQSFTAAEFATVRTTSLPAGMYILQVQSQKGAQQFKFVKQ